MILLPAIDIRHGKCVRLLQGKDDAVTVYGDDPVAVAKEWVRQGARWLHVVNLDGAFGRASDTLAIVKRIVRDAGAPVEFGGGLRSMADIEAAAGTGVRKLVIGTAAFTDETLLDASLKQFGADRIVVAIDAKEGMVATKGWTESSGLSVLDAARKMEKRGVREVLYTDVSRDGMMTGPDIATMQKVTGATSLNVIASGGVASLEDVRVLKRLNDPQISGVVVGKALYEGRVSVASLLDVLA